jgi:mannose-6-phosphate isomerase-like protein (cupin superfamily)
MHVLSKDKISPTVSPHGEIIHELIGRTVGESTQRQSVAHVTIPPGKSSLLHYHPEAEESYYILEGKARMLLANEEAIVVPGQAILIPPQKPHKIINVGETDLAFLAFCVPAWEPTNTAFPEKTNEQ